MRFMEKEAENRFPKVGLSGSKKDFIFSLWMMEKYIHLFFIFILFKILFTIILFIIIEKHQKNMILK